jgi:hypothetical protein
MRGAQPFASCWPACCPAQGAPKLKVAVVGSGLGGLSTAVELLDQVGGTSPGRQPCLCGGVSGSASTGSAVG